MDHKGLPVKGYTDQPGWKVRVVNEHKVSEEILLRMMDAYGESGEVDPRWLAIARTHLEQGFMALNRAVFQPQRVNIDEEKTSE